MNHLFHRFPHVEGNLYDVLVYLLKAERILLPDNRNLPLDRLFDHELPEADQHYPRRRREFLEKIRAEAGTPFRQYSSPDRTQRDVPFFDALCRNEPKLSFVSFDSSVLLPYTGNAQFRLAYDDLTGSIWRQTTLDEDEETVMSEDSVLESFGFAYDSQGRRAIAAFLMHLGSMPEEDQRHWHAHRCEGDFKLHPAYYKKVILGKSNVGISVFEALLQEIRVTNQLCAMMGLPHLFWDEHESNSHSLRFMVQYTAKAFNDFIIALDEALAANINRLFFVSGGSDHEPEEQRCKGSVQLLDEWLAVNYKVGDRRAIDDMICTFQEIRDCRLNPGPFSDNDSMIDHRYFQRQRSLMFRAYDAVRILRFIFSQHPATQGFEIPATLGGKIWTE